jgi:hypothetical protein
MKSRTPKIGTVIPSQRWQSLAQLKVRSEAWSGLS